MSRPAVIVALDQADPATARACAASFRGTAERVKLGSGLFTRAGPALVRELVAEGFRVFLDLKFHDTPATVGGAVAAAAELDIELLTLHAAGGPAMLAAARAAADAAPRPPRLLGVTLLTSLDAATHARIAGPGARDLSATVRSLAALAREAGLDGCVCATHEAAAVAAELGPGALVVVPGIRPAWSTSDHSGQARLATPAAAAAAGATHIVVGRAVTAAADPAAALARIEAELASERPR
ncbi:MAG: orotidine-5'-phosphate decarboxylase [Gemmatimonadota bacterium]